MRLGPLALLLAPLLAFELLLCPPSSSGKPKVDVRVTVDDGIGKIPSTDSLSKSNSALQGPLPPAEIFYFNVTVVSDNAAAVAQNDGKWCLKGDSLLGNVEYHGTLSGNDLQIEVPQKNGKTRKSHFVIYDHKWRKLADL
jgi:hypothetical protein